jgi:hypothetical protein
MYSAALRNYEEYLRFLALDVKEKRNEMGPHRGQILGIEADSKMPFDPIGQEDARERVLREIVKRRGQPAFRRSLIAAYDGRCAITGCEVIPLLEAAHITPYLGPATNTVTNGLLLRADVHTLWDLALIAVEPRSRKVWVSSEVIDSSYRSLADRVLTLPLVLEARPSANALWEQWRVSQEKSLLGSR